MADFINTIDVLGDDAVVDSIIQKTITEFHDDTLSEVGQNAFRGCSTLNNVKFPAAIELRPSCFYGCASLAKAEFDMVTSISSEAFCNCSALKAVVLRNTSTVATLSNTNAFPANGYFYVPTALVDSYKSATNWSTFADQFRKLEEWTVDGTVTGELDVDNRCMVRFFNDNGTLLGYKVVTTGSDAVYDGDDPVCSEDSSWPFEGFAPSPTNVTADMDCYAQYEEPFSLETASWAEISAISAAGTGANYFSVGETKSIEIKGTMGIIELDTTLYVYILGFNHNSAVEGNGIHFGGFKTNSGEVGIDVALVSYATSTRSDDGTKCFNLNHWGNSIYGGWAACDLRYDILGSTDVAPNNYGSKRTSASVGYDATDTCATNPVDGTLMSCLPEELRAVMKPITKWSSNVGTDNKQESCIVPSVDYLPLLAEFEVLGQIKYANVYEQNYQQQYAYYASGNSIIKYLHTDASTTTAYWTRSPQSGSNAISVVISTKQINGSFAGTSGSFWTYGIAPVFMV